MHLWHQVRWSTLGRRRRRCCRWSHRPERGNDPWSHQPRGHVTHRL